MKAQDSDFGIALAVAQAVEDIDPNPGPEFYDRVVFELREASTGKNLEGMVVDLYEHKLARAKEARDAKS